MFSVSPAEIVTIVVIALLVFGPQRLPEITRRIGRVGRELSQAAQQLRQGIEREIEETTAPLDEVRRSLGATVSDPRAAPSDTAEAKDATTADDQPTSEADDADE